MYQNKSLNLLATLFVIIGSLLILENYHVIEGVSRLWPGLIMVFGIGFVMLFFEREKNDPVLIWMGTFLILLAIFFFYLNYTSWNLMVRLWSFFLGIIGLSFFSIHIFSPNKIFLYLAISFVLLFIIFYLVFGISTALWPISMIIFGISLLIINFYYKSM